jgi:hypothetical protein
MLWPGELINARLLLETRHNGISIASSAVQQGPNGAYVYVVGPERTVHMRAVTVAEISDSQALIDSGLKPNETVVLEGHLSRTRLSRNEETWLGRERIRMLAETAYQKFHAGEAEGITAAEAERFFRVDDYVVGDARKEKLERAKSAFANEPELRDAIQTIAKLVREK